MFKIGTLGHPNAPILLILRYPGYPSSKLKDMKNLFIIAIFSFFATAIFAQQQPHNTQFYYYKLGYNPAYAGSQESPCATCIYRQQWLGLEGAPSIAAFTFNMPLLNQRVGIGGNLYRHTIGITTMYNLDAAYAYRVRVGTGMLGIGVMASARAFENDYNKTTATQGKDDDIAIPTENQNKVNFNFGTGIYFNSEIFYAGVSAPRLLQNNIDFSNDDTEISREVQHVYLMGGFILPLGESVKMQPQTLVKYVAHAPVGFDANFNFIFSNRFIAGVTYRLGGDRTDRAYKGESVDLLVAAQLTKHMMFGISYDFTLSDVKDHTSGSIEASFHYCFGSDSGTNREYLDPRFF